MDTDDISNRQKIALFGGSFDPVHLGHLGMAAAAREAARLDAVVFLPCFVSPFKKGTHATGEQRAEMLAIALEEANADWAELSRYEISRPEPSVSWQTASYYAETMPGVDWYWIVGTDQWEQIEKWSEPEKLRKLLHFIVVTRGGSSVAARNGWRYTPVEFSHPASSTKIRADVERHGEWLTPKVLEYCRNNGLYGRDSIRQIRNEGEKDSRA